MNTPKRDRIVVGLAAVLVLGLAFSVGSGRAKEPVAVRRGARRVVIAQVEWSPPQSRFRTHGVVDATERASLSFSIPGRLAARPVGVGDRVQAGQLLARLDARGYAHAARAAEAAERQADAQLSLHERDRARLVRLEQAAAVSPDQLERLSSTVQVAQASRDAAQAQRAQAAQTRGDTDLRAPFAGIVVAVLLEPGEFALPGKPLIILSGEGALEVQVGVPGRIVERLHVGDEAQLVFPLDADMELKAPIRQLGESAWGEGRLFPVRLAWPAAQSPGIRPGASVQVTFAVDNPQAMTVPSEAIVAPSGEDAAVYRVRGGRAERVPVAVGAVFGKRIGIKGDLRVGDPVIVAGYAGLVASEQVELSP